MKFKVKDMVQTALLIATVYVCTAIYVPSPFASGGMMHLGNIAFFTATLVFGRVKGAIAGGVGLALLELTSVYAVWAPFTLVIRAVQGIVIGTISWGKDRKANNTGFNILALVVGAIIMIAGYYIAEVILYGNWLAPIYSIPGNIVQLVIGIVVSLPLSAGMKKVIKE